MKEFFNKIWNGLKWFFGKVYAGLKFVFGPVAKGLKFVFGKISDLYNKIANWISAKIPYQKKKSIWGIIFLIPLAIGFIYFFMIPFIRMMIYSFSYITIGDHGIQTKWVGLLNYQYIFNEEVSPGPKGYGEQPFTQSFTEALLSMLTDIPTILIFSLLMAVILNSKFRGRALVRAIFFMPVIFNSQAVTAALAQTSGNLQAIAEAQSNDIFNKMFNFNDFLLKAKIPQFLVNFISGVSTKIYDIISYSGIQIIIFLTAIQGVPAHLYEAAKIEGATAYDMFWKITFPMVSPMMLTAAVYTVVDSFLRSSVLTNIKNWYNKGINETPVITYGLLTSAEGKTISNYGVNAAMSVIFCLMSIVIVALVLGILSKLVFYYDE